METVQVNIEDDVFLVIAKEAHLQDITFNQMFTQMLTDFIAKLRRKLVVTSGESVFYIEVPANFSGEEIFEVIENDGYGDRDSTYEDYDPEVHDEDVEFDQIYWNLRDWYRGCAVAFQASEKSSNLLSRSTYSVWAFIGINTYAGI